jgi:hypothetical protein
MLKSGLIASVCAMALLGLPAMAAGTPAASTTGKHATVHHKATHVSTGAGHGMHAGRSASARDNMADQLNAQSLQAAMQGRPFAAGSTGSAPPPTPVSRP